MNSDRTYDVVLSYPHKDKKKVKKVNQILEALRSKKLNVWIDQVPDSNDLASLISGVKAHVDEINA